MRVQRKMMLPETGIQIKVRQLGMLCYLLTLSSCVAQKQIVEEQDTWTFVSVPDFLNRDTYYPQPGFEEGLDFFLQAIKTENPDFVLVAGDLVNGRWASKIEPTKKGIEEKAAIFYPAWKARLEAHDLKYYVAVGDHEVGDNPWPEEKAKLVPVFEEQFRKYMKMPDNGPENMKGLAYYFIHKNNLFVAVDVFEPGKGEEGNIVAQVTGQQLEWLKNVLEEQQQVDHVVVMGHTPILGPVNRMHSSGMMLEKGQDSPLWQVLKKYKVDLYLCGEVHAITCTEKDGVQQIAHGSLFGWNPTVNYLVGRVSKGRIDLELKEIDIVPEVVDRKSLSISFTPKAKKDGFRSVGTMIIDKSSDSVDRKKTGDFIEEKIKN